MRASILVAVSAILALCFLAGCAKEAPAESAADISADVNQDISSLGTLDQDLDISDLDMLEADLDELDKLEIE